MLPKLDINNKEWKIWDYCLRHKLVNCKMSEKILFPCIFYLIQYLNEEESKQFIDDFLNFVILIILFILIQ